MTTVYNDDYYVIAGYNDRLDRKPGQVNNAFVSTGCYGVTIYGENPTDEDVLKFPNEKEAKEALEHFKTQASWGNTFDHGTIHHIIIQNVMIDYPVGEAENSHVVKTKPVRKNRFKKGVLIT